MSDVVDVYTGAVHDNLRPLRANWEPSQPIALGDFGTLSGEAFQRLGNVSDHGIAIGALIAEDLEDQKIFSSSSDTTITFVAGGAVPVGGAAAVKASVHITFGSSDSVFFNAAGCSYSMIGDKASLADKIMAMYDGGNGKWQREWAVVTDLVASKSTTIAISSADNASIVLEAQGAVPQINLADATLDLGVKTATNVGYQVIAKRGLKPLIGLCKIQSGFLWWGDRFKPLATAMMAKADFVRDLQDSPAVQSEPASYLQFSQLG